MSELNVLTQEQAISISVEVKFSVVVWHALHLQRTTSEHFGIDWLRTSFEVLSGTSGCAERVLRWCVSLPPACVHDFGRSSASAAFHYDARCWCIRMSQCVHLYAANYVRAWVSAPHAQMDTVSPASTDSLTGCARLVANGAGPRRCTAGVTPASVRTRDRRTEARTPPQWQTTSGLPRCDLTTRELATHEKTR